MQQSNIMLDHHLIEEVGDFMYIRNKINDQCDKEIDSTV